MILLCNANEELEKEKRLVETLKKRNVDGAVSYTHLDVYKRQEGNCSAASKTAGTSPSTRTAP